MRTGAGRKPRVLWRSKKQASQQHSPRGNALRLVLLSSKTQSRKKGSLQSIRMDVDSLASVVGGHLELPFHQDHTKGKRKFPLEEIRVGK